MGGKIPPYGIINYRWVHFWGFSRVGGLLSDGLQALSKAVEVRLTALLAQAPTPDGKLSLLQRLNDHADKKVGVAARRALC